MKKNILVFLLSFFLSIGNSFAGQWRNGTGENTILGTTLINDVDSVSYGYIVDPLDRVLSNHRQGINLSYSSGATIVASSGQIVVSDSGGTIRLMLSNTSSTNITFSDLDTGAEASGVTYYVYAIAASSASTTATFKISTSASAPSGVTYYKRLGSFYNDSSSNISIINNDDVYNEFNSWTSKTVGVTYQASSDGFACATIFIDGATTSATLTGYTDSSSSPTTVRTRASCHDNGTANESGQMNGFCMPVLAGDYYKVIQAAVGGADDGSTSMYFLSTN